jgi:glycine/D-amino acid oxidase-like deaminating enzyme/nitrite reductase/ring-hydroxylating ferredoxin subunit
MATLTRSTSSPWGKNVRMPPVAPLRGSVKTDVCIVGAGIAGLSVAYELSKAGKKVAVLDDGRIGGGQTSVTTAHLSNAIDCRYFDVERVHGADASRLVASSHTEAINTIERNVRAEQIDCKFERLDGYLFQPPDDTSDIIDRELEAAHKTGVLNVSRVERAPLPDFNTGPCLKFENQAQFHPLKYLAGLARAIHAAGGEIYSPTHAESVEGGSPAHIHAKGGTVTADAVVVATNTPINDLVALHTKQAPYLTYVIGARVPVGVLPHALFWDTADPYHYVRLHQLPKNNGAAFDLVIVGGEDHKSGQADDGDERYLRLEQWARERIPQLGQVEYHWAGQVMESIDGLAYIGRNPRDHDNVFVATGDCGQGMTHGTIAGMLIRDLILGQENPWERIYDPRRITLRAAGPFAKEAINMAAQYTSWLTPGEIDSAESLKPGEGGILRQGLQKVAAYRDPDGKLHQCSAVCPHLGCIVAWNTVEQSWDCPCHGSRFTPEGKVTNGPANSPLTEWSEK